MDVFQFHEDEETARPTSDQLLVTNLNPKKAFSVSLLSPLHSFATFDGKDAIVEYNDIPKSLTAAENKLPLEKFKNYVTEAYTVLNHCKPSSAGVLKSIGYFWNPKNLQFGLIYEAPHKISSDETEPLALSSMLREPPKQPPRLGDKERAARPQHPLNQRFELATKLATAVFSLHATGWLHKDIQPDNILVFQSSSVPHGKRFPRALGDPYFVGLESARAVIANSDKSAIRKQAMWETNIFQHPERVYNDGRIDRDYTKAHDVYSLGIVLVEIGLWKPLSTLEDVRNLYNKDWNPSIDGHDPGEELKKEREKLLLRLARTTDVFMGDRYASIVENCLKVNSKADCIKDVMEQLAQLSLAVNGGGERGSWEGSSATF